jgi:dTDP-4-amino-4,6-dideoxygalactose transaminase
MIPFNKPFLTGQELRYIEEAHANGHLSGDGPFTRRCHEWLERRIGCAKVLLTHSCTGALEMAAMLCDIVPGDEVILPSFTFVSTANAFVLRGAVPVFVDIRPDTFNLDEEGVEAAITSRTKAIVPVHYAGIGCEMDSVLDVARRHDLVVIEDAAQGILSQYKGRPLGSIGQLAALSFHETKNVIAGEGGALLINDRRFIERAEIIWEKGTNRNKFFRGETDRYTWVDIGSSYLPSEINAAFLWAQLQAADDITARRRALWDRYHAAFIALEREGLARRPIIPDHCQPNAHMYHLLLSNADAMAPFLERLRAKGIHAVFHYVPLHSSPAGKKYGRAHGSMASTEDLSARIVRLPLWLGLEDHLDRVIDTVIAELRDLGRSRASSR